MIETKKFNLTQKEYTKIIVQKRFKKSWWLYLIIFIAAILNIKQFGKDSFSTFFVIFGFTYPFISIIWLYFWSLSKDLKPIFSEMELSFDDSNIYAKRNGNESKIPFKNLQKIVNNKRFWMLYLIKGQFIYVPKNIFYSENDFKKFSTLINNN